MPLGKIEPDLWGNLMYKCCSKIPLKIQNILNKFTPVNKEFPLLKENGRMEKKSTILIADNEERIRLTFEAFLKEEGYSVITSKNFKEALGWLDIAELDLVFADILLGDRSGIDLLREIRKRRLKFPFILIAGAPDFETAAEALRLGAYDYIPKPIKQDTLTRVARIALSHRILQKEKEKYQLNLEAIFNSVKDGIVTVDQDLKIVEFNYAAGKICGLERQNIGENFPSPGLECQKACQRVLREATEKKKFIEISRIHCQKNDMHDRTISLSLSPLVSPSGKHSGAVMVLRDETRLDELERNLKERTKFQKIIGKSPKMQEIYSLIEALADVDTTVLITGESGTGKELVAQSLHYSGFRSEKPLVTVNCAALSENLLESELFGHVKGSFTGAIKDKIGRFQQADGGTIFLDEIGDISPSVQVKLLRVLQEKQIERVGDSTAIKVDVRIVTATNHDLRERVKKGQFRQDLYFRLKVFNLHLPPLRQRREDIPLLVEKFVTDFNKKLRRKITGVSPEVLNLLMNHPWPGNVRELENILEHAFILCRGGPIQPEHLPLELRNIAPEGLPETSNQASTEAEKIRKALEKAGWNKAKAARMLGISRRTLYRKISDFEF
jgi:two-component system response regulator HydG